MNNQRNQFSRFLNFLICLLLVAAASIRRDGKLLGHDLAGQGRQPETARNDTVRPLADGTTVVNTTALGKDITGFGGTVPLEIEIRNGVVKDVRALPNHESPEFFERAQALLALWKGKRLDEASAMEVDGVSGATYSSRAIIGNMKAGLQYAGKHGREESLFAGFDMSAKNICGLAVALMAAVVPLFVKNRRYRIAQQVLNVVVLGFWCGSFMSWASLLGYMSNGMNAVALLLPVLLLIVAFVYPLFGKQKYYCTHVCPYGSLQELVGRGVGRQMRMSAATVRRLNTFHRALFAVLMLCLWTGVWSDWVDYEPFSAFIFQSASWVVIAIAVAFVLLSSVVMRPYCRFVCPMGMLLDGV